MNRKVSFSAVFLLLSTFLTGCGYNGEKAGSLSVIYLIAAFLALLALIGYATVKRKKQFWLFALLTSVLVINVGYYLLAVSQTLEQALWANRISYLGSVFLPMIMWMIIRNVTRINTPRWLSLLLSGIGLVIFLIAASPGILDIYYKEVTFVIANGVGTLQKVYGPFHSLYFVYLLGYFFIMVGSVVRAIVKKQTESPAYATLLAMAVFVNIGVWLIEQLVNVPFEMLSISYIISELFLLGLDWLTSESSRLQPPAPAPVAEEAPAPAAAPAITDDQIALYTTGVTMLTQTERMIYDFYLEGHSTKQIMAELNIKENTLKFHNKNIYSKLGVSSRKQLIEIHRHLP